MGPETKAEPKIVKHHKPVPVDASEMKDAAIDFIFDPATTEGAKLFAELGL
ncbi:MAG: hypothetical protein ABSA12_04035 [Verrucomicrobiia bacterium]|jgi:hypothetical protein